jgi:hypothetical protein
MDRRREGGIIGARRPALGQDVLADGLLEALVEDLLHASRLTWPGHVLIDLFCPDRRAEGEGDKHEAESAEGGAP